MRCLQCGKALPLLKRLSGGEFCSDAHRNEYQQEYTNLALGRLQQALAQVGPPLRAEELRKETGPSNPPTSPVSPVNPPPSASLAAPMQPLPPQPAPKQAPNAQPTPPTTPAPTTEVPPAPLTRASLIPAPVTSGPDSTTQPRRTPPVVPRPQPKAAPPRRDAGPVMAGTLTRKPPAAKIRRGRIIAALAVAPSSTLPVFPHRQDSQVSAGLATASTIYWAPMCELRESTAAVMESKLDVRGFVRIAPVMDVGMSVIPLQGWDLTRDVPQQSIPMMVPDAISPGEPALWNAAPRQFTGSVTPPGGWAALTLSAIKLAEEVAGETRAESTGRPAAAASGQKPAPLAVEGIAAGKARPAQVFTAQLTSGFHARIPQLEVLPLRPTMVLGPAVNSANAGQPAGNEKPRKPDVRILAPEKPPITQADPQLAIPLAPAIVDQGARPAPVSMAQPVPQFDLGPRKPRASSGRSMPTKILTLFGGSQE